MWEDPSEWNPSSKEEQDSKCRCDCYYDRGYPIPFRYPDQCRGIYYVVQEGDTLYSIGKRYHVSVRDLIFANPYAEIYNLPVGVELCIPTAETYTRS